MSKPQTDISDLSFELALSELESIVQDLESGKAALEDSISSYERGTALKKHCEKKLQEAQMKIEKISVSDDGKIKTAPFESQE